MPLLELLLFKIYVIIIIIYSIHVEPVHKMWCFLIGTEVIETVEHRSNSHKSCVNQEM